MVDGEGDELLTELSDRSTVLARVAAEGLLLQYAREEFRDDYEVASQAIEQTGLALKFASAALRGDRGLVKAAVSRTWIALEYASDVLRGDREIVLIAIAQCGLALKDASVELQADEDVVQQAISIDGGALAYASQEIRSNREFVLTAIDQNPKALEFASEELRGSLEIVCPAVRRDGSMLRFASQELCRDRDVVLDAVSNHGQALAHASEKVRGDREVVNAAVSQCGTALAYASTQLQDDDRIARVASRQDIDALKYASMNIRNDREFMLDAVDRDGRGLRWAADLRNDPEVVLAAVRDCGTALADASCDLRADKRTVMVAVKQDGRALLFASHELRQDREVVFAALAQNGGTLVHTMDDQIHDRSICRTALAQDGMALAHVPENLRCDREVVIAGVTQCGLALQYAPYDLRGDVDVALAALNEAGQDAVEFLSVDLRLDANFLDFALSANPELPGVLAHRPKPLARKFALAKVRRFLEPILKEEYEVGWLEVVPVLKKLEPLKELEAGFKEPDRFLANLASKEEVVAKAWVIVTARPILQLKLPAYGTFWEDFVAVLELMALKELRTIADDPDHFLLKLSERRVGPVVRAFAMCQLRPHLEPVLPKHLEWADMHYVLEVIDSPKEIKDFIEGGMDLLMWKLINGGEWPPARRYARVNLRVELEPKVPGDPKPRWRDFFLVLKEVEEGEELDYMLQNIPRWFRLQRLDPYSRTAKLWAFAQLHPMIEEALEVQGNTWEDVLPMLEEMDTMRDLQEAVDSGLSSLLERLSWGPELRQRLEWIDGKH